jgi:hypothetical protein
MCKDQDPAFVFVVFVGVSLGLAPLPGAAMNLRARRWFAGIAVASPGAA